MANQYPADDREFEDSVLTAVDESDDGYTLCQGGACLFVTKPTPIQPRAGMVARYYGRGFGYTVRGVFVDGHRFYYRTEAEHQEQHRQWIADEDRKKREEFEASREETDRRVAALPTVLRRRLQKFRDANPNFRWEFEGYELFTCEQAVVIATALKDATAVESFSLLPWEGQKAAVPGLDDGHSGNTFGMACRLAYELLTEPELVVREHGALATLVGCEAYGCVHGGANA